MLSGRRAQSDIFSYKRKRWKQDRADGSIAGRNVNLDVFTNSRQPCKFYLAEFGTILCLDIDVFLYRFQVGKEQLPDLYVVRQHNFEVSHPPHFE